MEEDALPIWRQWLFRVALVTAVIAALSTGLSWTAPFPLLADGHGGYSDVRNTFCFFTALIASLGMSVLALFGRGLSRILIFLGGIICLAVGYGGLLANGV